MMKIKAEFSRMNSAFIFLFIDKKNKKKTTKFL